MKRIALFICSLLFCLSTFTSCGFGMSDSLEISDIKAVYDETTGITTVTITYLDDIEEPLVFEIPKGEQGETGLPGAGIDKIIPEKHGDITKLIFHFTDGREPYTVEVLNGKDGISIVDVETTPLEGGAMQVVFIDSNGGKVGDPFIVPAGVDGDKITGIVPNTNADGSVTVTVSYSKAESETFTIPAANGISSIESSIVGNDYKIKFLYTNGSSSEVSFLRPASWLSGNGEPMNSLGIEGDFYFDLVYKNIYIKKDNGSEIKWEKIADLEKTEEVYTIVFMPGSGASINGTSTYTFAPGQSFSTSEKGSIPIPQKEGYVFKGWYAAESGYITENNGQFTDLTPVTGNLTLHPQWKKGYKLTFNGNGSGVSGGMGTYTICKYESFTLPKCYFSRRNYTFMGWSTTADGEVEYQDLDEFWLDVSQDTVLYAVWQAK